MTEPTYDLARFVKPAPASSPTWEWLTHLKVEERRAQIARRSLSQQVSFLALAAPSFKASEVETGLRAFLDDFNRSNEEPGLNPSGLFSDSQAYYGSRTDASSRADASVRADDSGSRAADSGSRTDASDSGSREGHQDRERRGRGHERRDRDRCISPFTGERLALGCRLPSYDAFRSVALAIVAEDEGADLCSAALDAMRHAKGTLSSHISLFRDRLEIYEALSGTPLNGPMLSNMFVKTLSADTIEAMHAFPTTFEASVKEAQRAHGRCTKKGTFATSRAATAPSLSRHAVNAFSPPTGAESKVHQLAQMFNTNDKVKFIETLANFAHVDLDLRKVIDYTDDHLCDLKATMASRFGRCNSYTEALNALTHLMPTELIKTVKTSREEGTSTTLAT